MEILEYLEKKKHEPFIVPREVSFEVWRSELKIRNAGLMSLIKMRIIRCKNSENCLHCKSSFGGNLNKLNCLFKIKPKDVTVENFKEFLDDFLLRENLIVNRWGQ